MTCTPIHVIDFVVASTLLLLMLFFLGPVVIDLIGDALDEWQDLIKRCREND